MLSFKEPEKIVVPETKILAPAFTARGAVSKLIRHQFQCQF